ncbi:hypothetical protein K8T06_13485 [bacterium]|nr:hypothetical protein [bacterium]
MTNRRANRIALSNAHIFPRDLRNLYLDLVAQCFMIPKANKLEHLIASKDALFPQNKISPTWSSRCCFLEHGMPGLRDDYFRANQIFGRNDLTFPFRDVTSLIKFVVLATGPGAELQEIKIWLERLVECRKFIILCDLSMSGNSLVGDVKAIKELHHLMGINEQDLSYEIVIICGSVTARHVLEVECDIVIVINEIPECFSSRFGVSLIIERGHRQTDVESLCKWFRDEILPDDSHIHRLAKTFADPNILLWGFGGEGWLVAGNRNTPNNSLPILWLNSKEKAYVAPYPRVPSRLYEHSEWNLREPYMEIIRKNLCG